MKRQILKSIGIMLLLFILLILVFVPFGFNIPEDKNETTVVIAHRGSSGNAPENTIAAIDSALAVNSDYIEIDVHLTKDKKVIVMHDQSLNRTTNGEGKIEDLNAEYIRTLDAGSWFGSGFKGVKVPFLSEVIEQVGGKSILLIEIKKKDGQYEGIERHVRDIIRKHNAEKWCHVQSFNDEVLQIFHNIAPEITLHKLIVFKLNHIPIAFDGKFTSFSTEKYHYVKAINMHFRFLQKNFAESMHQQGKLIHLWGCRKESPCFPIRSKYHDGIITDFPALFVDLE